MDADDREISEIELEAMTGVSRVTWQKRRRDGSGPTFIKYENRLVRYRMGDVKAWLEARGKRRRSTTEHLAAV